MKKQKEYSKEAVEKIKDLIEREEWEKIMMIYYAESEKLPSFVVFLKNLKNEEGKKKIIDYLLFKRKNIFFEQTGFLKEHFFDKMGITEKNKEFLIKRDYLINKIK
jgi:hypothetical protein